MLKFTIKIHAGNAAQAEVGGVKRLCGIISHMKEIWLRLGLALCVAGSGLYLALHGIQGAELRAVVPTVHGGWLLITLGMLVLALMTRAWRLRLLCEGRLALGEACGIQCAGYALSNLLPLRAGDPGRALLLSWRTGQPLLETLAIVGLERVLDLLAIMLLVSLTLPALPTLAGQVTPALGWLVSLGLLILLGLLAWVDVPLPAPLARFWAQIRAGLRILREARRGTEVVGLTLLIWLETAAYFYLGLLAFVPGAPLISGPLVTWATALGIATPVPGGIGPYHAAIRLALTRGLGVADVRAVGYALVIHALQYLGTTLPGIAFISFSGLTWRRLTRVGAGGNM